MRRFQWLPMILVIACLPLAASRAEAPKGEAGKTLEFNYGSGGNMHQAAHVHFPADWKPGDKRPAIVFFFGGGWTKGTPKQFENQAAYLARRGMVAIRADYTLQKGPDVCVADARSAIRWMREHAAALGIDPDRIVSSGGSAGGHLAACLGCCPAADDAEKKTSSRSNAMILFNPALDMEAIVKNGKFNLSQDKAAAISPLRHADKGDPPAIIFFGTDDRLIEPGREFVKRYSEAGNRGELFTAAAQGHGFFNRSPWQERTLREAEKFLFSIGYLKGESTLKLPASDLPDLKLEPVKAKSD